MVGALHIRKVGKTAHTDFISIIEYRQLLGKHPSHHHLELVGAVARTGIETQMVVIAGNGSKVAPVLCPIYAFGVAVIVFEQHSLGIHTPVDFVLRPRIAVEVLKRLLASVEREIYSSVSLVLLVEVHTAVAGARGVEIHIHIETGSKAVARIVPLGHQHPVRIVLVHPAADFAPESDDCALVLVVFDKAGSHVHTEAVHALAEPEGKYVLELLLYGKRPRVINSLLPRMVGIRIGKAEIQGRLAGVEILHIVFRTLGARDLGGKHPLSSCVLERIL